MRGKRKNLNIVREVKERKAKKKREKMTGRYIASKICDETIGEKKTKNKK